MSDQVGKIPETLAAPAEEPEEQPEIRFGEVWIPAHLAWKKMETANVVVDRIDHFNTHFPHLASPRTRAVVPEVRKRLKDVQVRIPKRKDGPDLGPMAIELLNDMAPEDVLDQIEREHGETLNLRELIALAGEKRYLLALRREAEEFEVNRISPDQTAQVFNEMARPAPGGGLWTQHKVQQLLDGSMTGRAG